MNPIETLRVALRALLRNKMRSFLTMLGIIIGVGAVIAMVAIGEGAKARVEESFASMGSNLLIVMPGALLLVLDNQTPFSSIAWLVVLYSST